MAEQIEPLHLIRIMWYVPGLPPRNSPLTRYAIFSVILCYDHLLTLNEEIQCIWKQKFSLFTIIFFLNRYLSVAGALVQTLTKAPQLSPSSMVSWITCIWCLLTNEIIVIEVGPSLLTVQNRVAHFRAVATYQYDF